MEKSYKTLDPLKERGKLSLCLLQESSGCSVALLGLRFCWMRRHRDSKRPDKTLGSTLRASDSHGEPPDIMPPPGFVTESRGRKGLWTSRVVLTKIKDEPGQKSGGKVRAGCGGRKIEDV